MITEYHLTVMHLNGFESITNFLLITLIFLLLKKIENLPFLSLDFSMSRQMSANNQQISVQNLSNVLSIQNFTTKIGKHLDW